MHMKDSVKITCPLPEHDLGRLMHLSIQPSTKSYDTYATSHFPPPNHLIVHKLSITNLQHVAESHLPSPMQCTFTFFPPPSA